MKTIKIICSILAIIAWASCSNAPENTTTDPSTPAAAPEPAPSKPKSDVKEDPDHTEIGVDQNGVSYKKKSGTNQTDVKIKTDSSSIYIKKRK
jgi:hypothetical protein